MRDWKWPGRNGMPPKSIGAERPRTRPRSHQTLMSLRAGQDRLKD